MNDPIPVGIDVGSKELVVAVGSQEYRFPNTDPGHRALIRQLTPRRRTARVVSSSLQHLGLTFTVRSTIVMH